jgi:hypothetical protein
MMANKEFARLGIKRWCYDIPMTMKVFPSNSINEAVRGKQKVSQEEGTRTNRIELYGLTILCLVNFRSFVKVHLNTANILSR